MSYQANKCVIFGIDPGKVSGWAIFAEKKFVASGVATTHEERETAFVTAIMWSNKLDLPLIVGRETWTAGGWKSHKGILGMGAAWGKWEAILDGRVPKNRVFGVNPNVWRKAILGLKAGKYTREQAKRLAKLYCSANGYVNCDGDTCAIIHDQAEATCIAYFMIFDDRVAKAIKNPKRLKKI